MALTCRKVGAFSLSVDYSILTVLRHLVGGGAGKWYNNYVAQYRKDKLVNGQYYHIYNRSIAKFIIFNNIEDYDRFCSLIKFCRFSDFDYKLSGYLDLTAENQNRIFNEIISGNDSIVQIVAYCLMPTHIHLLIKQNQDGGISKFMSRISNSYSKYFNTKYKRNGPLWSGRFKSVLVDSEEQLLHLTRYFHLNPTSAELVDKPGDWEHSSYSEYICKEKVSNICEFSEAISMNDRQYKNFVESYKDNQREKSIIKYLTIDNYSG